MRTREFGSVQAVMLAVVLAGANACQAQSNVRVMGQGLLVQASGMEVELAPADVNALRLSVAVNGRPEPARSTFLADPDAGQSVPWGKIEKDGMVGIRTAAGQLLIDPHTAEWTLQDADGKTLIPKHALGGVSRKTVSGHSPLQIQVGWDPDGPIKVYGCGNGTDALQQSEAATGVGNGRAVIPFYWAPAGYAVLAVTANDNRPASWRAAAHGDFLTWTFPGPEADLYLMPAPTLKVAAQRYADLTGHAPVPPRWALGYLQSRWGWKNRAYIEDTLKHFRELNIPVDAFIYDFEWYTIEPDYDLSAKGAAGFSDFGWDTNLFPDPAEQIAAYHGQGIHFVGIRKPRMGNRDTLSMIRARGWNLSANEVGKEKFQARDVNFANPAFRKWYVKQSAPLIRDGVDGWWNDEGEATFTTYFYWNLAERTAFHRYRPGRRLWTLNRAFSPGLQRLGAAAWTGDIRSSWKALAATPTSLLNWSLAGMPYGACDIGGFIGNPSPELLSRWMEAGVFFPVMRSHSEIGATPRFPWRYGPEALKAIRKAIDLRYRLIPFYYSLAHETFGTGLPLMRPLVMEFPDDPQAANISDEWLMGPSVLAAPVLEPGDKRSVYLPSGGWYVFGTNRLLQGRRTIQAKAALDQIPIYIRTGTILPLGPVIQHTDELPGGSLELQIYPGQDATFTLFEDDGKTTAYLRGRVRRTTFTWHDATGQLSWQRQGEYAGKDVFRRLHVVLFGRQGRLEKDCPLDSAGRLHL